MRTCRVGCSPALSLGRTSLSIRSAFPQWRTHRRTHRGWLGRLNLLAVLGGGRISFKDLCSEDLFRQDQFNPLGHCHSDEDAEGEEGVGFEVFHIGWFFLGWGLGTILPKKLTGGLDAGNYLQGIFFWAF